MKNVVQTPVDFYDQIVPVYDLVASHNIKPYRRIVKRLEISPGKSALEVGCGTGNLTVSLAAAMARVLSIDFSSRMLERAAGKMTRRGFNNVTFRQMNAFDLTPEDHGKFDYCFTAFLLHVFAPADRLLLLSRIGRLATERVVVIDYAPRRYRLRYAFVEWLEKSHYKEFLQADLSAQAETAGLQLVRYFEQGDYGVWEFSPPVSEKSG